MKPKSLKIREIKYKPNDATFNQIDCKNFKTELSPNLGRGVGFSSGVMRRTKLFSLEV